MRLFHYHLMSSRLRDVESRYLNVGFGLIGRYGSIGGEPAGYGVEHGWEELDELGFRLRLCELERDGVNVVLQPGRWEPPLVDHVGVLLPQHRLDAVLARAAERGLKVQERDGRRTFVATGEGYRLELRRDPGGEVAPFELRLATDDPAAKAAALAGLLGLEPEGAALAIGASVVRFLPGGPSGRPRFEAEIGRAAP